MLKRNETFDGELSIDCTTQASVIGTRTADPCQVRNPIARVWKEWRKSRLLRQTKGTVAKLDARTQADIGWPWRFEQQEQLTCQPRC